MTELASTPGQTVGPFLHLGLPCDTEMVDDADLGALRLHGTVYDGAGTPIPDALIELWQADTAGRIPRRSLRRDGFTGWGRAATDAAGCYSFTTVTPGSDGRPPFFAITVFARGLLNRLFTRAYLPGADLAADPLLATLAAERRATLLCVGESGSGRTDYRFDIHLQGPHETVFLAYRDAAV
ncbi:protocatechuate 3,4-dioxygenase subunit alpha [Mycobacterium montefiorense]|uniref:protocatechuate 3,4-dioxygenase subunit alpha n=1 Tax=Mycobacterium montefiorense TaxID=154654 RepID=UPI0021DD1A0F|nr:protocatechuate 3,4-dioxygenase subunit alpha [Mycobacterium montefiorense]MCV7428096.1 protocatechuate 3,4-dioxygenase subunit alpha [Mycobacterium montefiorense]GLE52504.1 protocatechuate 3,4-dioxygenase subunit alpha [Mycobacterium montefiorense]